MLLDYFERETLFQLSFFLQRSLDRMRDRWSIKYTRFDALFRDIINIHILIRLLIVDCNVYINICSVVREKKRRATEQTRFLN